MGGGLGNKIEAHNNLNGLLKCPRTSPWQILQLRLRWLCGAYVADADMNNGGYVTSLDALMILQAAAGSIKLG